MNQAKAASMTARITTCFSSALSSGGSSACAWTNQFPTPEDSAEAEEYHRDHGRGHWRGQGSAVRLRKISRSRECPG